MAKKKTKRKTWKLVAGRKVRTNEIWKGDAKELCPGTIISLYFGIADKAADTSHSALIVALDKAFQAGIARGRALATASGRKKAAR